MSTQIEKDLRAALTEQAAELPDKVSARVLASEFRPRGSAGRATLAAAALTLTTAAALAVSVVGIGSNPTRAFAGWSATPTTARTGNVSRARSLCRSQLARMPQRLQASRATRPQELQPLSALAIPATVWRTLLIDTRGPYTLILYEAEQGRATSVCFAGSRNHQGGLGADIGARALAPVPAGHVTYSSSGGNVTPRNEGSHQFSWVAGRTGTGVKKITIRLNNRTRVTASRAKGWFLAWWPGSHGISATEVTTAMGIKDQ